MLNPLRIGIPLGVRAARAGVFALSFSLSSIALPVGVGMATAAAASAVVSAATASSRFGLIVSVVFAADATRVKFGLDGAGPSSTSSCSCGASSNGIGARLAGVAKREDVREAGSGDGATDEPFDEPDASDASRRRHACSNSIRSFANCLFATVSSSDIFCFSLRRLVFSCLIAIVCDIRCLWLRSVSTPFESSARKSSHALSRSAQASLFCHRLLFFYIPLIFNTDLNLFNNVVVFTA